MISTTSVSIDALSAYLEGFCGDLPPQAEVEVKIVRKARRSGSCVYAKGLITAKWQAAWGNIAIHSGWEAQTQPDPSHGWFVMPDADAKGEGIDLESSIINESMTPLQPDSDQLKLLAWDFWSYQDIAAHVEPLLVRWNNELGSDDPAQE